MEGAAWWDPGVTRFLDDFRAAFPGRLSVHPPAWGINIASCRDLLSRSLATTPEGKVRAFRPT